jgi:L-alanine-DL-glutamate epimerase-like enolase superfamily enzyme
MKITDARCHAVRLPAEEPLADGPTPKGAVRELVTLELRTDEGIEGIGFTFFGGGLTRSLKAAVEDLAAIAKGENPLLIEHIEAKFRAAAGSCGPGGILQLALAAVDIALWDIKGKALDLPVWALAGGHRPRVPTYASGALMRTFPLSHLVKAGPKLKQKGFRQMKTQLGGNALAAVTRALSTPIAGGEYVYGSVPFRHMLEAGSVDIVMIDILRAGGVTGWLKIAGMAHAFNKPVVSHLAPELQVHLVAAVPNGLTVEYMPWSARLFEEVPQVDKQHGDLVVPQRPGFGLKFDRKVLKKYGT